jgi:hypothetical protein
MRVGSGFNWLKMACYGVIGLECLAFYSEEASSNLLAGVLVILAFILPSHSHVTGGIGTCLTIGH